MEEKFCSMILLILTILFAVHTDDVYAGVGDNEAEKKTTLEVQSKNEDEKIQTQTGTEQSNKTQDTEGECLFRHFKTLFERMDATCVSITKEKKEASIKWENFDTEYSKEQNQMTDLSIKSEIQLVLQTYKQNYFSWNVDQTNNTESDSPTDDHKTKDGTKNKIPSDSDKIKNAFNDYQTKQKINSIKEAIVDVCTEIRNDENCSGSVTAIEESLQDHMYSIYQTIRGFAGNVNEKDVRFEFDYSCNPEKVA